MPWSRIALAHLASTTSGAPFKKAACPSGVSFTVSILRLTESKGDSFILLFSRIMRDTSACFSANLIRATSVGSPWYSPFTSLVLLQRTAVLMRGSRPGSPSIPFSWTFLSSMPIKSVLTDILFSVIVPVLSVQMTVAEPSVSPDSSLFTRAFLFAMRSDAMLRESVTVGSRPSGTFATIMPMANIMPARSVSPESMLMPKNTVPRVMAIIEMIRMK